MGGARHTISPSDNDAEPRVRFEKLETLLRVALDMRGNAEGLALADIERDCGVSRRTAERIRDAIERVFPQMEQANPGELPKRWRIRAGALSGLIGISAEELAALNTALGLMRRDDLSEPLARLEALLSKLKAMIHPDTARRVAPDLEILTEAEGMALRPGPRQTIASDVIADLRHAIIACKKVQLHYRARSTGALSRTRVCPYGFLYGNRHYLVADSLNPQALGFRLFSFANIEKVERTPRPFTRRKHFSLQKYAERSFGVFQEEPFDVVWRFSSRDRLLWDQFERAWIGGLPSPILTFSERPDKHRRAVPWRLRHSGADGLPPTRILPPKAGTWEGEVPSPARPERGLN